MPHTATHSGIPQFRVSSSVRPEADRRTHLQHLQRDSSLTASGHFCANLAEMV